MLAASFWLLASGFWLLASGFWLLASWLPGFLAFFCYDMQAMKLKRGVDPMRRTFVLICIGAVSVCAVLMAQQRVPQLPEPTAPHPNPSRPIPKPEGATLKARTDST